MPNISTHPATRCSPLTQSHDHKPIRPCVGQRELVLAHLGNLCQSTAAMREHPQISVQAITICFLLQFASASSSPTPVTMSSPTLLAGKAYASRKSITKFSQTTKFSVQNELENKEYFASHTPSIDKVAWCNTPDFTIVFALRDLILMTVIDSG
jgi:hypothetical protein